MEKSDIETNFETKNLILEDLNNKNRESFEIKKNNNSENNDNYSIEKIILSVTQII